MTTEIGDVAALEACVGKTPGAVDLKVIDHLDVGAERWVAAAPLLFACLGDGAGVAVTLAGGAPGFARAATSNRLVVPRASFDEPDLVLEGAAFGSLFLVPGLGETLRVNGRVAAVGADAIEIDVQECYMHCAKALIRSDFWRAAPHADVPGVPAEFLAASRFMALATVDAQGRADLSPKGDPAGALLRELDGSLWFADRPGNRRTDSFRNILTQPRVAIAALLPGAARIAVISGAARLSTTEDARTLFTVSDKVPKLVTRIDAPRVVLRDSPALAGSRLWPSAPPPAGVDPASLFAGHVKLNKRRGLKARLAKAVVSVPGLMQKGLESDYKNNLY